MANKEQPGMKAPIAKPVVKRNTTANPDHTQIWTILSILEWTQAYFKSHAIDSPRLTAEILLSYSLKIERLDLYLQYDRPLEKHELKLFKGLIRRRIQKEPVAYITGQKGFFESDFMVTRDVLIPRPDTECIVEQALRVLDESVEEGKSRRVLELGTGSGAIVVSLAKARPMHRYSASDISLKALEVAQKNARTIGGAEIAFCAGAWFSCYAAKAQFDLIVSNPPYIPSGDIQSLQPEIQLFEPMLALDGGPDGLDCYRHIIKEAHRYLSPGGVLLLEIGFDQKMGICDIVEKLSSGPDDPAGKTAVYRAPEFAKDLAGHYRVAIVKKSID